MEDESGKFGKREDLQLFQTRSKEVLISKFIQSNRTLTSLCLHFHCTLFGFRKIQRGQATTAGWNESSTANVPALSTSAAAIAGLLAGQQSSQNDESFDDLTWNGAGSSPGTASTHSTTYQKKKQSAELKRLLTHKRGLKALLEDAVSDDCPNGCFDRYTDQSVSSQQIECFQHLQRSSHKFHHRNTGQIELSKPSCYRASLYDLRLLG